MDITPILQRVADGTSYGPYALAGAVALGFFGAFLYFVCRIIHSPAAVERDDEESS